MLADLRTTLQNLLHQRGRISEDEVDVRFEMPTRQWVESLTKPTINMYLFDVQENTELRTTTVQQTRSARMAEFRMPPRRFDLRFMVSMLTTIVEDEHLLLWRTLQTLMKYAQLPDDLLSDTLREARPAVIGQVSKTDDGPNLLDVWSALELPPRPSLLYVVTVPLELDIAYEAPLVLTRTVRYARPSPEDEAAGRGIDPERSVVFATGAPTIGGTLRNHDGTPVAHALVAVVGGVASSTTNEEGRFTLRQVALGPLTLQITRGDTPAKQVVVQVPSESYDITLD